MAFAAVATAFTAGAAAAWWYTVYGGSISPDGTKVAYVSNETGGDHVRVVNADGTGKHIIAPKGRVLGEPHFVAGGAKVVFCSLAKYFGDPNVYVVDVDGSHLRRLTDYAVADPASAAFPWDIGTFPAGGRVQTGFVSGRRAGEIIYYVDRFKDADDARAQPDYGGSTTDEPVSRDYVALNYNDGAATVLVEGAVPGVAASFSPDGGRVVYAGAKDGALTVYLAEIGRPGKALADFGPRVLKSLDVSWDAGKVLCLFGGERGAELWVMNLDGSSRVGVAVPRDIRESYFLCAGRLIFVAVDDASYVATADGSDVEKVADCHTFLEVSPGGEEALLVRGGDIYAVRAEDPPFTNLTADWEEMSGCPLYSPDGKKIAFYSYPGGPASLYIMNRDGSDKEKVAEIPWESWPEQWSLAGDKILISAYISVPGADGDSPDYAVVDITTWGIAQLTRYP